ncbi:MAG: hypothetical protein ABIJ12_13840 [bacterium]
MNTFTICLLVYFSVELLACLPVKALDDIDYDIDLGSKIKHQEVLPPPDLRNWTPQDKQFQLYINSYAEDREKTPKIDILNEKGESCHFWMENHNDTVYLFIIQPGFELKESISVRNRIDSLDQEFPLVVLAGTMRAVYWFSYDSATGVEIEPLKPASFIETIPLLELPTNVFTLQLEGNNNNARIMRQLLIELGNQAELIQLDKGFYRNYPFMVKQIVLQKWKTNETKTGTLLAFKYAAELRDVVEQTLEKYRRTYAPN